MFHTIIFPLILIIRHTSCEQTMIETLMDELGAMVVPFGEPLSEDLATITSGCEKLSGKFLNDSKDKYKTYFSGTSLLVMDAVISKVASNKSFMCQLLEKGESDKVGPAIKEYNKHVEPAKTLYKQLISSIEDAIKPDTKVTYPVLLCYLKEFRDKYIAIFSDNDIAKDHVKSIIDLIVSPMIDVLEPIKGKAAEKCQLPAPPSQEKKHKSMFLPFLTAIKNLDNLQ